MKRRHRVLLSTFALVSAGVAIGLVTSFSTATEGPLAAALDRIASVVDAIEHRARERFVGPGRSRALSWFADDRLHVDALRRPESVLLGAYDSGLPDTFEGLIALERSLDTVFPLVQIYAAWGDAPEHAFPIRAVSGIWTMGSVPVITWEPWLSVFESARHPHLPLQAARDQHGLAAVARGDYDFYIDAWAAEAARFEHPIFIRFAHEMNDPYRYPWGPQNNTKEEFIAAWRHVVDRFNHAGATNVLWVWSPHVAHPYWDLYYPGTENVDWVATGALNFGPIAQWSQWWSFSEIFGTDYPLLAGFGKPIMVAEFGSLGVGGDRAAWYREALTDLPTRYPQIRSLLFFHAAADQTVTYQKVDWTISNDASVRQTIADALRAYAPMSTDR